MSEWATQGQELARKSLERLTDALLKHEEGSMTTDRLYLEADVLSEITQGLIPYTDWEVIDTVRRDCRRELRKQK